MNPVEIMQRWWHRLDRERLQAFAQFLWVRFWDDRCFETAGALAYTTLFGLVPLSMVVFGILQAFPVFDTWSAQLTNFVFSNFVPGSAAVIQAKLREFSAAASSLTSTGVLVLLGSLLVTMWSIESTFNRIWRVPTTRPKLGRFLMYWALLTLGTLVAVGSLALTSYVFALPVLSGVESAPLGQRALRLLPNLVELSLFTVAYWQIPHRTVPFRFALLGGLFATLLFEIAKQGFAFYLLRVPTYETVYGTLAAVPIFLIWIYVSWVVVLLGASLAASLSAFRYQPRALRLPPGAELYGYLRLLGRLNHARRGGKGMHLADFQSCEPMLTDDHLQRMLSGLCRLDIVRRAEDGAWLLSRDLDGVTLAELHEGLLLRVPGDIVLPGFDDPIGREATCALEHLRTPLYDPLSRSVGSFFPPHPEIPAR